MHLQHFSHQHPLVFCEQQSNGNKEARCSGCNEPVTGPAYCCTSCGFYLHKRCAELPLTFLHPLHPQHTLNLLAKSPYPDGIYMCDLCENVREGFVYRCSVCEFDLDSNCAFHPKLTSKFDISRSKNIIAKASVKDAIPKKKRNRPGETGKLDTLLVTKSKFRAFGAKDSEEKKYREGETDKLDSVRGKQRSSLDFGKEDLLYPWPRPEKYSISKEEKIYGGGIGRVASLGGNIRPFESKDIVRKKKKIQGETGNSSCNIPSPCIFRTPFPKLEFQKPELVSIGPYHMDEEHQLDKYKHSFLDKLLCRTSNNQERDLSFYVGEIIALEKQARACYSEDLVMSSRDFVKMMLLDGCFTIELLRHFGGSEDDLFPEDPINIIMPWQIPILVQDLLLLENQIPFFILDKLFYLSKNHESEVSLTSMALKFFDLAFPRSSDLISEFSLLEPNHLLDLFVKTIRPSNPWNISSLHRPGNHRKWNISNSFFKTMELLIQMRISDLQDLIMEAINSAITATNQNESENHPSTRYSTQSASSSQQIGLKFMSKRAKHEQENQSPIPLGKSVADLRQAGIEFIPSRSNSFLDFNFKDGMLEIPLVTINNLFSTIIVNSIALENRSYYNKPKPMTTYVYFMSSLVKEANDVKFLCSDSDNDKKVADLFNLLRDYALVDMSYSHLWKTVRAIESYNGQSRTAMRKFLMETSVVLIMFYAITLLIICLFCLGYITRKLAQFLAVYGSTNLICILSLQRCWRHVLRNPVQRMVIISTFFATFLLFLLSSLE